MNIQDLIALKAQKEVEDQISQEEAALIGAGVLGTGGLVAGHQAHRLGNSINKVKDALAANRGLSRSKMQNIKSRVLPRRPFRPAGAIIGVAAGGGLGAAIQNLINEEAPAANLLAKYQSGQFTEEDAVMLEGLLKEMYNNPTTYGMA